VRLTACVVCGSVDDVHHHPLVGNSVEPWNLITLCEGCRAKLMSSSTKPKRRPAPKSRGDIKPSRRSVLASAAAPPVAVVPSDADPRSAPYPPSWQATTLAFDVAAGFFVFALQWRPFIILAGICRPVAGLPLGVHTARLVLVRPAQAARADRRRQHATALA
jgi:hypothetical protein